MLGRQALNWLGALRRVARAATGSPGVVLLFTLPASCALDWELPAGVGGQGGAGAAGAGLPSTTSIAVGGAGGQGGGGSTSEGGSVSSAGGAGGAGGGPTLEEVQCQKYARWACEKMSQCNEIVFESFFGSAARCEAHSSAFCLESARTPDTAKTPEFFAKCAEDWPELPCYAHQLVFQDIGALCPFSGKRPNGAACAEEGQCQSGSCFFQQSADTCGTCVQRSPVGGACNFVPGSRGRQCVGEAYCKPDEDLADDEICVKFVGQSGDCGPKSASYLTCGPGLTCVYSPSAPTVFGKCEPPKITLNSACAAPDSDGFSATHPPCSAAQNLICIDGACQLATYGAPGDACVPLGTAPGAGQFHACESGICLSGKCAPLKMPGEPCAFEGACGANESDGCCFNTVCSEGVCKVLPTPTCG